MPLSPRCGAQHNTTALMAAFEGSFEVTSRRSIATVCKFRANGSVRRRPYALRRVPFIGASTTPIMAPALWNRAFLDFTLLCANLAGLNSTAATVRSGTFPMSATMRPSATFSNGCTRIRPPHLIESPRKCSNFYRMPYVAPSMWRPWRLPPPMRTASVTSRRIGRESQSSCSTRRRPRCALRKSAILASRRSYSSYKRASICLRMHRS